MSSKSLRALATIVAITNFLSNQGWAQNAPHAIDSRLTVELVVREPELVTPTGITVDQLGRIFVAESHTHFRPDGYDGPKSDRILMFEDLDGDGKPDRRSIFHEGFTHIMDIEVSPDGALYVATRMDIHKLQDLDNDRRADRIEPIVRMETEGNYPHNGLSGLAFDIRGGLNFGLGENLGKAYVLTGTDGKRIAGGGEGGSTYYVKADGTQLVRTSTGWWNPFGMCVDAMGRVFGTDNDPDASPPCRLIQVVPGGDYGYEFRYGRTGLHPLITWNGTLPGTLPMISGTGEAPCAVISYDAEQLPAQYRGHLLVASWADHRVEHYPLEQTESGGLVRTVRKVLIEGPDDFRPVGLATGPDGSVYVSDWVSSSYTLHKLGRVWRIRSASETSTTKSKAGRSRTDDDAVRSPDRSTREAAANRLSKSESGIAVLKQALQTSSDAAIRATVVQVLAGRTDLDWRNILTKESDHTIRMLAARAIPRGDDEIAKLLETPLPAGVRSEIYRRLDVGKHLNVLVKGFRDSDPLVRHAIIESLAESPWATSQKYIELSRTEPLLAALAWRRNGQLRSSVSDEQLRTFAQSDDPQLRLLAVKWIADDQRLSLRGMLAELMGSAKLDVPSFLAIAAALDRIDGRPPVDRPSGEILLKRLRDADTPPPLRLAVLRLIDPTLPQLEVSDLARLTGDDSQLGVEAVRTLSHHASDDRLAVLLAISQDNGRSVAIRRAAISGLASAADRYRGEILELCESNSPSIRDESLRALVGISLSEAELARLDGVRRRQSVAAEAIARIRTGRPEARPAVSDVDAWLELSNLQGDAANGESIFFGAKVATCAKCHQFEGRGSAVGPDLSRIQERVAGEATPRKWLLETVLSPGKQMAPHYTPWVIELKDGRTLTGLPRRKGGNSEAYLGADGKEFTIKKDQIESHRESQVSLMPQDLLHSLTRQEIADLLAFLTARK